MSSNLMTIASSGAKAARAALDVTAQNIANASSEGYVRRSVSLSEVAAPSVTGQVGDASLSGVRLDRVVRNVDNFRISELRRTTSDLQRSDAELSGLQNIEASIENAQIYTAAVGFEGTLGDGPNSLTLGAGIGVGVAGSIGLRDIDDDGIPELCAKLSVGFITLGVCAEN